MGRVFITGSADGLGSLAAKALLGQGHKVVLHARNKDRAAEAMKQNSNAETILTADLSDIEATKNLAHEVNELGTFDAVIHNAGLYNASAKDVFTVNTLAPYILSALIKKPNRLIYLSSGMHLQGQSKLEYFKGDLNRMTYSDTKLHVLMLCKALARKWPEVYSNAVNPGWVPTKMGGKGATDDLQKGFETQVWLATSNDENVKVSGRYFFHKKENPSNPLADDVKLQEKFLSLCEEITAVSFE